MQLGPGPGPLGPIWTHWAWARAHLGTLGPGRGPFGPTRAHLGSFGPIGPIEFGPMTPCGGHGEVGGTTNPPRPSPFISISFYLCIYDIYIYIYICPAWDLLLRSFVKVKILKIGAMRTAPCASSLYACPEWIVSNSERGQKEGKTNIGNRKAIYIYIYTRIFGPRFARPRFFLVRRTSYQESTSSTWHLLPGD